ncbi:MAG: hypothetical protein WCT31_01135, partial [Candidatus Micrarchaeia archaeon]
MAEAFATQSENPEISIMGQREKFREKLNSLSEGKLFIPRQVAILSKKFFIAGQDKNIPFLKNYADEVTKTNAQCALSLTRVGNGSATHIDYAVAVLTLAYLYSTLADHMQEIPEKVKPRILRAFEIAGGMESKPEKQAGVTASKNVESPGTPTTLAATPVKKGIFDWGVDFDYNGNSAGRIARLEPKLNVGPVGIGLGGGAIAFDYFDPQPYLLTSLEIDMDFFSNRWNIHGSYAFAHLPKTEGTAKQQFHALEMETDVDVARGRNYYFRVGADWSTKMAIAQDVDQLISSTGFGVSGHYNPMTAYVIGRFSISEPSPIKQNVSDLRLFPASITAGLMFEKEGHLGIRAEFEASKFEKTARLAFKLPFIPLGPELTASYTRTSQMLGSENMGSIGLSVPIGTGRASATQEIAKNEMNIRDSKTQTHKFLRLLEDYENLMAKGKEDMAIDIYRKMRVMADEYHLPYNTVSTNASQIIADYKEGKMAKTECIEELFGYPKGYINSSEYPDSIINNNKKAMKIDDFVDILLDVTAGDFENLGNLEEYMLKSRSEAERFEYALYQNIKNCKTIGQLSAQYENSNIADKIKVAAMLAG